MEELPDVVLLLTVIALFLYLCYFNYYYYYFDFEEIMNQFFGRHFQSQDIKICLQSQCSLHIQTSAVTFSHRMEDIKNMKFSFIFFKIYIIFR